MKIVRNSKELERLLKAFRANSKTIGFVPTMGFLHDGHLSIIHQSRKQNDVTIASIFVNPLQFGPKEDFKKYPRDEKRDSKLLAKAGCDILYLPSANNFYPKDFQTSVYVNDLSKTLCGITRPHHFGGVATVVLKLLNVVRPTRLYLGQKDFQQYRVVGQMIHDLSVPVTLCLAPIVREKDGLAMSSRNVYLSLQQRKEAVVLRQALLLVQRLVDDGQRSVAALKSSLKARISSASSAKIDYAEIVDAGSLRGVLQLKKKQKVLVALAVYFGSTRLIDNVLIEVK